jgi:Tol biopolymer transport system component
MQQDVWIRDLEYAREYRLTLESGAYGSPRWSSDSGVVAFECMPISMQDLCMKAVGAAGKVETVYESPNWNLMGSFMPGGRSVVFVEQNPETSNDIWLLDLDDPNHPTPLVRTRFNENRPELSPDGRWLAYISDETGRFEVYVREAREDSRQWQVSVDGGREPRWNGDGSELFFASTDGRVMAAAIRTSPVFRAAPPKALFTLPETPDFLNPLFEDVTRDGERFLLNLPTESRTSANFHAIFNWTALLEE